MQTKQTNNPQPFYAVNLDAVIKEDIPSFIKDLAKQSKEKGYISVPGFFRNLPTSDLNMLMQYFQDLVDSGFEDYESGKIVLLVTLILLTGEGLDFNQEDYTALSVMMSCTGIFATVESLKRKGLVEVDYTAFTYDLSEKKAIAKPIQQA